MRKYLKTYLITLFVLVAGVVSAGLISRITTFTDGSILYASDLNAELNQLVNLVNGNIDNDNISSSAAISPAKITAAIAGDGLGRNGSTGAMEVNDDDTTLTISSDTLKVKDNGVGNSQLRTSSGLSVVGRSANTTGNVADITGTDGQVLRVSGTALGFGTIATAGIADAAVTQAKRAALGQQVASSSGSYSGTSGSLTTVTNQSVTITTTGRPVMLQMVSDYATDTGAPGQSMGHFGCQRDPGEGTCLFGFERDSTLISFLGLSTDNGGGLSAGVASSTIMYPCGSMTYIDVPSAGTYTYTFKTRRVSSGGTTFIVNNCHMVAYEL